MEGLEIRMTVFIEDADRRYIILIYQRKYSWKQTTIARSMNASRKICKIAALAIF